jgi:PAP2 superfamily
MSARGTTPAATVQVSDVLMNRDACVDKAATLIAQAAHEGARIVVLPDSRRRGLRRQSTPPSTRESDMNRFASIVLATGCLCATVVHADAVTDWNLKANEVIVAAKLPTQPAVRVMAIVQTAAHQAVMTASQRGALVEAALVAAHRVTLGRLLPAQQPMIDAAYQAALGTIPDDAPKFDGIADGESAAEAVLSARTDDGAAAPETYRPHTTAGVYVPTTTPAVTQWPLRKPWLMRSAAQFRPAGPPALNSDTWARDFNEVKAMGGRTSARRSAEQTEVARFWDYSAPPIYHALVRSVAMQPGRSLERNARLFAAVAQAMDDALIAVFEAKYHYRFWRPATAIRNADTDGNAATEREAGWSALIDVPMHPEYPAAHSVLAAALGTVLAAEVGDAPMPVLETSSPTVKGAVRRYDNVRTLVQEVSDARIWGGVHYRTSTEVGAQMGRQVGALAVAWQRSEP